MVRYWNGGDQEAVGGHDDMVDQAPSTKGERQRELVAEFDDPYRAHNDRIRALETDLRAAIDERDRSVAEAARLRRLASFYRRAAVIGEAMTKTDAEYLADLDAMGGGL
jgi:hypothetical protein